MMDMVFFMSIGGRRQELIRLTTSVFPNVTFRCDVRLRVADRLRHRGNPRVSLRNFAAGQPGWRATTHQLELREVAVHETRNRLRVRRVNRIMSIDKESDGVPEVNLHRRTTKVNLVMIIIVSLFILGGVAAMWWMVNR
jgi:hypothetical protein